MERIEKHYASHSSCQRHLNTLSKKGVVYTQSAIEKLDEGAYIVSYKVIEVPLDLVVDMSILLNQFCDMFNCNDESLERNGIDWAYMHKLNRRVQFRLK
jgi:predicted transcriptional regulator